jgi:hypothetical protein
MEPVNERLLKEITDIIVEEVKPNQVHSVRLPQTGAPPEKIRTWTFSSSRIDLSTPATAIGKRWRGCSGAWPIFPSRKIF